MSKSVDPNVSMPISFKEHILDEDDHEEDELLPGRTLDGVASSIACMNEPKLLLSVRNFKKNNGPLAMAKSKPVFSYLEPKREIGQEHKNLAGKFHDLGKKIKHTSTSLATSIATITNPPSPQNNSNNEAAKKHNPHLKELERLLFSPVDKNSPYLGNDSPQNFEQACKVAKVSSHFSTPLGGSSPFFNIKSLLNQKLKAPLSITSGALETFGRGYNTGNSRRTILKLSGRGNFISQPCSRDKVPVKSPFFSPSQLKLSPSQKKVSFSKNMIVIEYSENDPTKSLEKLK